MKINIMKNYLEFIKEHEERIISGHDWNNINDHTTLIDCSGLLLTSIPIQLPSNLTSLNCSKNRLKILPELPESLIYLTCSYNILESLPELPPNLKAMTCENNLIKILPKLPDSLEIFYCADNPLECLIPEKFYDYQRYTWLKEYLQEIKTYEFQKRFLERDPNQILELLQRNIIHSEIRKEFSDLISSVKWGMI